MKETILVTGGTGFIGSHTTVELQQAGYDVVIIDNLSNSNASVIDGIEKITGIRPAFEKIDLNDFAATEAVFKKYSIKGCIHFAASKAVGESVEKPLLYYRNNLNSLMNVLELMTKYGGKGIIFSSSCTVYGQPTKENLPVTEQAPIQRELPNGVPMNLIPFVTQTAIGIRKQLKVFGNDYDTPDHTCIRDYIYVVDLAKAHVKAMQRVLEQDTAPIEVFNIGTGHGYSTLEIVEGFERATGVKLPWEYAPRREGDIEAIWGNVDKANKVLGWSADTPLDDILRSAWKWQKKLRAEGVQ